MTRTPRQTKRTNRKRRYIWRRQAVGIARARRRIRRQGIHPKSFLYGLLLLAAAVGGFVLSRSPSLLPVDPVPVRFFQISTGSPGGTYFTVGTTLAAAISRPPGAEPCAEGGPCGVTGLIAIAKAAPGSIDNVRRVHSGRIDSALAQADVAAWAYTGARMFKREGRFLRLRAIASLYPEAVHLVAAKQAGIASLADLRGKRVSIGRRGSGTRSDALLILRIFGIRRSQIKIVEVDPLQAADMILSGRLDAFFAVAGTPSVAVSDLAGRGAINLVPIDGAPVRRLFRENAFFLPHTIERKVYNGLGPVKTVSVRALWLTHADADAGLVHDITQALWGRRNRALLDQGHAKTRLMSLKTALNGLAVPLHEGARAFYLSKGLITN
jgi:TRAP transporter TAXI family solute receptor